MRGVIILSEGRSGTTWLASLANSTGLLGRSDEWVDEQHLGIKARHVSADTFISAILEKSATDNDFFAIKMFPRHLHWFQLAYGFDIIGRLRKEHDLFFVVVTRNDRIKQAVSFARALQNNAWTSLGKTGQEAVYDFDLICRCYFGIGRSYDFWRSYVALRGLPHKHFVYEDMLPDPSPYVYAIAEHAGVDSITFEVSPLKIQRDAKTDEWCERFRQDAESRDFLEHAAASVYPTRKMSNFFRFLRGKSLKPASYTIR
ncbi:MAG: Stf0 sulfotransferase [Phyllobacteriaceae bacterium]|nr:Stf0 sulfotransferase [Phyllobacteriaceae bacterium]MBA91967.1 Stf0 sulfotransferase [Phyllobacteriaceae bacterium]